MRVLVYGMSSGIVGGVEVYLTQMSHFIRDDVVFDYVIEGKECRFAKTIKQAGGSLYYVCPKEKSLLRNWIENERLLRKHKEEYEVVYFNLISLIWIEPIWIARALGYKVIVHSHLASFVADDVIHHLIHRLNKNRLSHMDLKRLACSAVAKKFMFRDSDPVKIIHNAVDIKSFQFNNSIRTNVRTELRVADDVKVIGYVGRLKKQKNPLFLPEILNAVIKKYGNKVVLLVIGEGELMERLHAKIIEKGLMDKYIYLGVSDKVNEYYQAMDVMVLPSLHEGFPIVSVEAQVSGLHCVVSDRISTEIDITGNVEFLSIESEDDWGDSITKVFMDSSMDRLRYADMLQNGCFDICVEAKKLSSMLMEAK